jgi:hypothetical protein
MNAYEREYAIGLNCSIYLRSSAFIRGSSIDKRRLVAPEEGLGVLFP